MRKNNGIGMIRNHEIIIKRNCVFHLDENFPYPNINTQHDCTFQPDFLEMPPEVKVMIKKWTNENLDKLSCENVLNFVHDFFNYLDKKI